MLNTNETEKLQVTLTENKTTSNKDGSDEDTEINKSYPKKAKPVTQQEKLKINLINYCRNVLMVEWSNEIDKDLPKKYKLSQDLLILPSNCFQLPIWSQSSNSEFYKVLADTFRVSRVAQENRVKPDDFRSPNLTLLLGNDPNVSIVNNGIKYSYDITKCMFSWGNITEKLRIASFDCSNEVIVDLFAGIGYFTLPYLVHAKAKHLIACEWNPASVEALKNNLILNNCESRCEILEGDNREKCPKNCADRVNLGLIPSSEMSWPQAANALRLDKGGYLHVHGNVDVKGGKALKSSDSTNTSSKPDWIEWSSYVQSKIKELLETRLDSKNISWNVRVEHIEHVKSYGPRVDHLVLDLLCKPTNIELK